MNKEQMRLVAMVAMTLFLGLTLIMLYIGNFIAAGTFLVLFSFSMYFREINK